MSSVTIQIEDTTYRTAGANDLDQIKMLWQEGPRIYSSITVIQQLRTNWLKTNLSIDSLKFDNH